MWRAVGELGFEGGRVLEPGCGSGNFIGFAPDGRRRLIGVELDPTTAADRRAPLRRPGDDPRDAGFEELRATDGALRPRRSATCRSPRSPRTTRGHNRGRHALHNYFLIKALHLTRPGGLVVALTSRYTLDARNPAARREIAASPTWSARSGSRQRAFAASSGTDVVVDLLVLRRRDHGAEPAGPGVDASCLPDRRRRRSDRRWRSTSTSSPTPSSSSARSPSAAACTATTS